MQHDGPTAITTLAGLGIRCNCEVCCGRQALSEHRNLGESLNGGAYPPDPQQLSDGTAPPGMYQRTNTAVHRDLATCGNQPTKTPGTARRWLGGLRRWRRDQAKTTVCFLAWAVVGRWAIWDLGRACLEFWNGCYAAKVADGTLERLGLLLSSTAGDWAVHIKTSHGQRGVSVICDEFEGGVSHVSQRLCFGTRL